MNEKEKWESVGQHYADMNKQQSIQIVRLDLLKSDTSYKIELVGDEVKEQSYFEKAEIGERYS